MADARTTAIIEAKDNTGPAINSAKSKLTGFQKSISSLKPAFEKMAIGGTVAFAGIAAFAGSAVAAATEANKSTASLNAVLASTKGVAGVTADEVDRLSKSLAQTSLFEDDAIKSAQAMLLTFTKVGKEVFPDATQAIVDMASKMGGDLQGTVIQVGKALNNPIEGISALSRVGVQFTDVQKDMIKKMVEGGDVAGAQALILAELKTEFGGVAAEMAKADPFGQMKKSIGEMKESIGQALLPALNDLVAKLAPVITKVTEWIERNPELVSKIIIVSGIIAGLTAVVGGLAVAMFALTSPFSLIALAITGIIVLVGLVAANFDKIKIAFNDMATKWKQMWTDLRNFTKGIVDSIIEFFKPLISVINSIVSGIEKAVSFVGDKLSIGGGGKKKKVNDAIITPGGDVIETAVDDYIIATKNPFAMAGAGGGGPQVHIHYPMLLDSSSVQTLSKKIGDALRNELRI